MTRLLVLLALLVVAWVGLQRVLAALLRSPQGRQLHALFRLFRGMSATPSARGPGGGGRGGGGGGTGGGGSHPEAANGARLVRCVACNTHVPESRALRGRGDRAFCSKECLAGAERA